MHDVIGQDDILSEHIRLCILCLRLEEEPALRAQAQALERTLAVQAKGTSTTLLMLRAALDLEGLAWFCFTLALACELDSSVRAGVRAALGQCLPTLELAGLLYGRLHGELDMTRLLALADTESSPLRYLLRFPREDSGLVRVMLPLAVRQSVLRFVLEGEIGSDSGYRLLSPCADKVLPLHTAQAADMCAALDAENACMFFLTGVPGSGKRTLVRRVSGQRGCLLLALEWYESLDEAQRREVPYTWALDAALSGALVCVTGYLPQREALLHGLLCALPLQVPFVLCSDLPDCPPPLAHGWDILSRHIGILEPADNALVMQALGERYDWEGDSLPGARMTVGQLRRAWLSADVCARAQGAGKIERSTLLHALQECAAPGSRGGATRERLCDLVVAPETLERLETVRILAQNRSLADARQRAEGILPYGCGVTALFYGPSGTGKTMAARALASELGLALRRIDLSQVLDKYIGETEKHLSEIFREAAQQNVLLFFDEADALFGKRTEISSSHDRYANVKTAYLLQEIELYDGLVLMATNLSQNIDQAFVRRISVMVRFSMPDMQLRRQLWQRVLPPQLLGQDVDLEGLSEELELSPAALSAAAGLALALAAGGRVTVPLLARALAIELDKEGGALSESSLCALLGQSSTWEAERLVK